MVEAKKKNEVNWGIALIVAVVVTAIIYGIDALGGSGGGTEQTYEPCSELAKNPGTDVESAKCWQRGDLIDYEDSDVWKALNP